jgi:DNA repair exonuclease SbcCD ATPase subunit
VPSVLLHLVVLTVWILLPEEEPREPGDRKLTIKPEQAEELQEHLEEANLEKLRQQVEELRKIKETMAKLRDREMEKIGEFEVTMDEEAPKDVVSLLTELADIYRSVNETYQTFQPTIARFGELIPPIQKAAKEDTISGIREIHQLAPLWDDVGGLYDQFEVAFYETGATLKAIEVKLEWVTDQGIREKMSALQAPMEKTEGLHWEAWKSVPYFDGKRARSFRDIADNADRHIQTIRSFRKAEITGQAETAEKRKELEQRIAMAEADLARVNQQINEAEAALKEINKNKDREKWNAKRSEVRNFQGTQRKLSEQLRRDKQQLSRTNYRPDGKMAQAVKRIEQRLNHALPDPPDQKVVNRAMDQQAEMIRVIERLIGSLEESP